MRKLVGENLGVFLFFSMLLLGCSKSRWERRGMVTYSSGILRCWSLLQALCFQRGSDSLTTSPSFLWLCDYATILQGFECPLPQCAQDNIMDRSMHDYRQIFCTPVAWAPHRQHSKTFKVLSAFTRCGRAELKLDNRLLPDVTQGRALARWAPSYCCANNCEIMD